MIALHRRTRTLERGIEWLPRHDAHYILAGMLVSARDAPPICVLQSTLKSIELHIRADGPWQYGLLTGQLCFCRRSERAYTLIDGSVECPTPDDEGDDYSTMAL